MDVPVTPTRYYDAIGLLKLKHHHRLGINKSSLPTPINNDHPTMPASHNINKYPLL